MYFSKHEYTVKLHKRVLVLYEYMFSLNLYVF